MRDTYRFSAAEIRAAGRRGAFALLGLGISGLASLYASADECNVIERATFKPQGVEVVKAAGTVKNAPFLIFRAPLRVNTDGAPNSYHPHDLAGATKAINHICNAISVTAGTLKVACKDAVPIFEKFRDDGWKVPAGYAITWDRVIAADHAAGAKTPCVFSSGTYAGYFGSLTALKNGLPKSQRGECEVLEQLDQRYIPALVVPGGANPLSAGGARVGDLVIARNEANGATTAAVIGDVGPPDNLGEGSVALNMALLERSQQPRNLKEARSLDTGSGQILVTIIPGSRSYRPARPFSASNISERVGRLVEERGFRDVGEVASWAASCLGG